MSELTKEDHGPTQVGKSISPANKTGPSVGKTKPESGPSAERRKQSHLLRIEVPLDLDCNAAAESYDIQGAMAEAIDVVLRLARLGTLGLLCGNATVFLREADDE